MVRACQPDTMESITLSRSDGKAVPALVCGPVGAPAIVAIQEWWGVDFEVKEHAQKIGGMGYRVLIPDLYRGKLGSEAEEAHHLMSNLDFPDAVVDVLACARHLRAEGSPRCGVTGFCMGGALAIGAAVRGADVLDCAAPFYGYNAGLADVAECKVPMQAHFGALDTSAGFSDPAASAALAAKLAAATGKDGKPLEHEVFNYPTVGHGFLNASAAGVERKAKLGQGAHDQAAVDLAWERLAVFFAKHLTA